MLKPSVTGNVWGISCIGEREVFRERRGTLDSQVLTIAFMLKERKIEHRNETGGTINGGEEKSKRGKESKGRFPE